jgi:hypothetical protein
MERRPLPKESGQRFTTFNQGSNVRHLHLSLVYNTPVYLDRFNRSGF